jgi:hypothetical protein
VTIQDPTQVTSCCNLLATVRQLSFNSRSARMSFSQVQKVFIVEHYLASRSYLTCQNGFRDTFPDSSAPNRFTIYRLVNCFRDRGTHHRVAWNMRKSVKSSTVTYPTIEITLFFVLWFQCNLFFDKYSMCPEWVAWLFDHSVSCKLINHKSP